MIVREAEWQLGCLVPTGHGFRSTARCAADAVAGPSMLGASPEDWPPNYWVTHQLRNSGARVERWHQQAEAMSDGTRASGRRGYERGTAARPRAGTRVHSIRS